MARNKLNTNKGSKNVAGEAPAIEFCKTYTTSKYYKEIISNHYEKSEAIKIVCSSFDKFCSNTSNVSYLIERYTKLYNHKKVTKPMAFSYLAVLLSVLTNICIDIFKKADTLVNGSSLYNLFQSLLCYVLPALVMILIINMIFKTFQNTYSPYDVFVIPYERERIHKELVARGFIPNDEHNKD